MTTIQSNPAEVNLEQLINRLLSSYQPVAVNQKSFFINEVSPDLFVATDQEVLCTLLGSLFYIVARCSSDTSITISATAYEDITVLHITDSRVNNYAVLYKFQHLQMLSEKIGGFLDISNQRNKQTIISYSFRSKSEIKEQAVIREMIRA